MENLENLYKEQQKALKSNNLFQLNEINKKIYEIREQMRKEKIKQLQKQNDDNLNKKIENILIKQ